MEYLCWRRKIFPVSSHLKPPLGYGIYLIDSITYWKYEIGLTSNSKEIGCPYICRWEKKSHLIKILQTERGKRCNRIALLRKHEGTCFLSLPTNRIAKKKPYNWKLITLVWPPCKFLTMSMDFDKNSSKWNYYSTDHKNHINFFFWTFSLEVIRPTKINILRRYFKNKTFLKMKLSKNSSYKSEAPKLIFSDERFG